MDHGGGHRDEDHGGGHHDEHWFAVTVYDIPSVGDKSFALAGFDSTVNDVKSLIREACKEAGVHVRKKQFQLLQCPGGGHGRYKHRCFCVRLGDIPVDVPGELHFKYVWSP